MDVINALKIYINSMIEECGSGMKVLTMDSETISIVSSVYSQSEMLTKEVYLFEKLDLICLKQPLRFLKAIVFIRPTHENLERLTAELNNPKFAQYYIYFSNSVDQDWIRSIAESDQYEMVRSLKEIYADYLALNPHLFHFNFKNSLCEKSSDSWNKEALNRITEGLMGTLLSLSILPTIRYQESSSFCKKLAQNLKNQCMKYVEKMQNEDLQNEKNPPLLLILDRKADSITPMLNQWTYQAMIHELLNIHNNCIDLSNVPGVPKEMKQIVLSAENDVFYQKVGSNIKQLLEEFQKKTESQRKIESIGDMKNFIEQYPQFKKLSGTLSKHITLLGELSRIISTHKLLAVSEVEQELACQGDLSDALKTIKTLIPEKAVRPLDALRLVMLYISRSGSSTKEKGHLIKLLKDKGLNADMLKCIEYISSFGKPLNPTNSVKSFTKKMIKGLQGVENIYTQHSCLLKEILDDLARQRLKTNFFPYLGTVQLNEKPRKVIIFFVGGITYEEALAVHNYNKQNLDQSTVILGGTQIHNFFSYLRELENSIEKH